MSGAYLHQLEEERRKAALNLADYERYCRMRVGTVYQGVEVTADKLSIWHKARRQWQAKVDDWDRRIREEKARHGADRRGQGRKRRH